MRKFILLLSIALVAAWNPVFTGCGPGTTTENIDEKSTVETVVEPASEPGQEQSTTPDEATSTPDEPTSTTPDEPASSTPDEPATTTPDEATTTPDASTETTPEGGTTETHSEGTTSETQPEGGTTETSPDGGTTTEVVPESGPEVIIEFNGMGPDPNAAGQITSVRAGTIGKIGQVAVTFLKGQIGSDPAGFFVQATPVGPALFVAVDPLKTTPPVKVGDIITFEVVTVDTDAASQKRVEATAIKDLKVVQSGYDVTKLGQDVTTNNDTVSALDSYVDELVKFEGKIVGAFAGAGSGFVAAQIDTKGVTGNADLKLRVPDGGISAPGLNETLGLIVGCEFTTGLIPMWRFRTTAQPSAFVASDLTIKSCPAAKLTKAQSTSPTEVVLTFDRPIDSNSVKANGSDFSFDNGLSAVKAVVSVNTVTVTTGTQDGTKVYKVTASAAIKDDFGKVLDSAGLTASFNGFNKSAVVLINEINSKIKDGCDLVELRVKEGGSMDGFKLYNKESTSVTFTGLVVKKNDFIVVHFDAGDTKCVPAQPKNETKSANELPASATPTNFDTAYDWYTTSSGFATTSGVVSLRDAKGSYLDAVLMTNTTTNTSSSSLTSANNVLTAKQWTAASGTAPATYTDANFKTDGVNQTTAEATVIGKSMQRNSNTDTNSNKDWTSANAATWGAKNTGQTDF